MEMVTKALFGITLDEVYEDNIDESFEGKDKIEYSEIKKEYKEFQGVQDTIIKNLSDLEPALQKAEDFIKKFESYKEGLGQGNRGSP